MTNEELQEAYEREEASARIRKANLKEVECDFWSVQAERDYLLEMNAAQDETIVDLMKVQKAASEFIRQSENATGHESAPYIGLTAPYVALIKLNSAVTEFEE